VNFTNASFGTITNYTWDFGDGSPQSNEEHPAHTFTNVVASTSC
jgi:PKD repeat protein